jgi:RNA polymerase sigma factor (TIGR02999 family)
MAGVDGLSTATIRRLTTLMASADPGSVGTITQLLLDLRAGDASARERMLPLVYEELRRIAARYMGRERRDHTLQPTALVHEAYLRLIDQRRVDWKNRAQFVGLAATMMRRILINHARDRIAEKRGGDGERVTISLAADAFVQPELDVIALHDALDRLAAVDARKAEIVELKFFGGLTTAEIGELLDLSPTTIERDWRFARAWLCEALLGHAG